MIIQPLIYGSGGPTPPTPPTPYVRPADWIDISEVANNEINLLVTQTVATAFYCTVSSSGTYSVDWGDGVIQTGLTSGSIAMHQHTTGGTWSSEGYYIWKVRIYATNTITVFKVAKHTYTNRRQESPILWVNFGTTGITDYSYTFYTTNSVYCSKLREVQISSFAVCSSTSYMFAQCYSLSSITLPATWGSVTNTSQMFYVCYTLSSITLPATWGNITNPSNMFYQCYSLSSIALPTTWGNVTSTNGMFYNCYSLSSISLPATWGNVTNPSVMFYYCLSLSSITLPDSWGNVIDTNNMFSYCYSLSSITLPATWGNVTNITQMFYYCYSLSSITLPATWGNVTSTSQMFHYCYSLSSITLPATWGNVTNTSYMFYSCYSLSSITLPDSWGNVTNTNTMFYQCYSLKEVINSEYLGTTGATQCDMTNTFRDCEFLQGTLIIGSRLTKFDAYGASGYVMKLTGLRLTNPASTFAGSSPQIDVSYTSLTSSALHDLFDDIPYGLASKTINITAVTGNVIYSKTCGLTSGSTVMTCTNTSSLTAGMEAIGTGLSTARAVTFQDAEDTVTLANHGLSTGMTVGFSTITSTTGIQRSIIYYVINPTTSTFQVSLTVDGAALPLTTNGSGNLITVPKIVSINPNVSITLDRPVWTTSASSIRTFTIVQRSKALLKGWSVTG